MQLLLPLFPKGATMISESVGIFNDDGIVQYIHGGLPIYAHKESDLNHFKYIISNLIEQGICRKTDIAKCFGVTPDFVYAAHKKFKQFGPDAFFGADNRHGYAHKIIGEIKVRIQSKLDKGQSVNSIAKEEKISEASIRYQIKKGALKKKTII